MIAPATRYGLLALLLMAGALQAANGAELRELKHPFPAGNFHLRDLDGDLVRLGDFQGRVVLLNFWATWCPPCRREMPSMQLLYDTYKDRGLEVVAISIDTKPAAVVRDYIDELGVDFPVLHDRDSRISRLYSVPGTPASYLIDVRGRQVYRVPGEYDWFSDRAREVVEGLLP